MRCLPTRPLTRAAPPYCIALPQIHQGDGMYCHACAYSKGLCALCGVQILDTKSYKQSAK